MAAGKGAVCCVPIKPQNGNLKCVAAHPEVLGACEVEGPVLLATDPLGNIRSRAGRRSVHQDGQMLGLE